jgi:exopolysaccharide biosynthesis polyprenyl glycosylphosphotransferase
MGQMQQTLSQPAVRQPGFLRQHYQTVVTSLLLLADIASIALSFYIGFKLRIWLQFPDRAQEGLRFLQFLPLLPLQVVCIVGAFFFARMYHRRRTRYSSDELTAISSSVSIGTLLSLALASLLFTRDNVLSDYPRAMVFYTWLLTIALVIVARALQARIQRLLQLRGFGRTRVAIIGAGDPASMVIQRIQQTPRLGYDIVGVIPSDGQRPWSDVRTLGGMADISQIIERETLDEVIVAIPEANSEELLNVISRCDRSTIGIKVVPDMFQIMAGDMSIGELGGLPLLNMRDVALRGWKLSLKRFVDLVGAGVGLVFGSPFFFLLAALIKLDSPGPALFSQERMGLDGRRFRMIKFRSMRIDAERSGPQWTTKDDPRRTRLGGFLRRTNLDELPNLINVFLGEMSLVGPRPEQPYYVEQFRAAIPRYMERHREKSGMTGWAQVNGMRGDTSIEERTKYDLWYIENWSVWLDIKIILLTIWQTIIGDSKNAH